MAPMASGCAGRNYDFLAIVNFTIALCEEALAGRTSGAVPCGMELKRKRYMEAFTGDMDEGNPGDPYGTMAGYTAALYYTEIGKSDNRGDLTGAFYEMGYDSYGMR